MHDCYPSLPPKRVHLATGHHIEMKKRNGAVQLAAGQGGGVDEEGAANKMRPDLFVCLFLFFFWNSDFRSLAAMKRIEQNNFRALSVSKRVYDASSPLSLTTPRSR